MKIDNLDRKIHSEEIVVKNLKSILLFIIAFLMSCENLKTINYDLALELAEKQQKYVLLDFTAIWCGGCKYYEKYIFNGSQITDRVMDKFIIVKIDIDKPENKNLVNKYRISGIPHIVIINYKEQILGSIKDGFDVRYINKPELFVSKLDKIIELQKEIKKLETIFLKDTTNFNATTNLLEVYQNSGQYIDVQKMKKVLTDIDPTPERLLEYNFNQAISLIWNEKNPDPLLTMLKENNSLDEDRIGSANTQLLYYYESIDDIDKQDYYYRKLMKIKPEYFKKNYTRFLFENNIKIDTAVIFTNELLLDENLRDDHWGQFLKAHSLVYREKKTQAVDEYFNWMEKNKDRWQSGETYWPLYFYARFANYHNIDLERALGYIKIAEERRNLLGEKLLLGEILYKLNKIESSIDKYTEALKYIDVKDEYEGVMGLINKYKKELTN